jgi:hypothetical protein
VGLVYLRERYVGLVAGPPVPLLPIHLPLGWWNQLDARLWARVHG